MEEKSGFHGNLALLRVCAIMLIVGALHKTLKIYAVLMLVSMVGGTIGSVRHGLNFSVIHGSLQRRWACLWVVAPFFPFAGVQFDFAEPSIVVAWGNIDVFRKIAQVGDIGDIEKI